VRLSQKLEGRVELRVELWSEENAAAMRADMQQLEGIMLQVRHLVINLTRILSKHPITGGLHWSHLMLVTPGHT
jgi:hypothetical protein